MAAGSENKKGPRLEFVLRKLPGTVTRTKFVAPPTKEQVKENASLAKDLSNQKREIVEPAGFMVFLPTGHCYRMSADEVAKRGFDRQPNIISFEQANDTKTAAGRFKLARSEQERRHAMSEMEDEIIKQCVGRVGNIGALIDGYDPHGKIEEAA